MQTATPEIADLVVLVQQLWTSEPRCAVRDRHRLLTSLQELERDVERLEMRTRFHPDEPVADAVAACVERYRRLAVHWPDQVGPLAA